MFRFHKWNETWNVITATLTGGSSAKFYLHQVLIYVRCYMDARNLRRFEVWFYYIVLYEFNAEEGMCKNSLATFNQRIRRRKKKKKKRNWSDASSARKLIS